MTEADLEEELDEVRETARDVFGWTKLRPAQEEAIEAALGGHDVLLVMPTGAGKSAVYQLPALQLDGPTLVVSPLIALQQDQVHNLLERGEEATARAVSSALSARERTEVLEAVAAGDVEFLFLAPEQLANDAVREHVRAAAPSLVAIDEAHCVSTWGHDFRPDYLRLGELIDDLGSPRPRVIALTATAAPPVRDDIVQRLRLQDAAVIVRGFSRPNIRLETVRAITEADKRKAVLHDVLDGPHPAILYTATRRETEEHAQDLAAHGLRTAAYHGGLRTADRTEAQRRFMDDELDVMVATSAFGMGIDKPDVRAVVHASIPDSPDSYYQEVGRAGRDGDAARAVLFYRPEDLGLQRFLGGGLPRREDLVEVAGLLLAHGASTSRKELAEASSFGPQKFGRLLNVVQDVLRRLPGSPSPDEVADAAIEHAEARQRLERSRLEMMRGYAETTGCRRQFVLAYFGEELPDPCGNCDTCFAGTASAASAGSDRPFEVHAQVQHPAFGVGTVMSYEEDRVTVLFE